MAQITSITSEALQATIRRLLPSQQGFGEDLQATNVITPIIDLTPSAEGSEIRADLQRSFSFGSITSFGAKNQTAVIASTPGFYRVIAAITLETDTSNTMSADFQLFDGSTTKSIIKYDYIVPTAAGNLSESIEFDVFLSAGDSCRAVSDSSVLTIRGSSWQIADVNGNLNNPSGFNPQ
tara:strand:- start:79 stop:615 length:537 start_codon:yes stop_codon:yes gene_type:complete